MKTAHTATVQSIRPDTPVETLQRLPYFIGISGQTVAASGLSMHLVVIPPGARSEPHLHVGYETGIYVLEGEDQIVHPHAGLINVSLQLARGLAHGRND